MKRKVTVVFKAQFYVSLFNLDPITRRDLGFLIIVEVRTAKGKPYRTKVPAFDEGLLDELMDAVMEEAAEKRKQVTRITVLACEEKSGKVLKTQNSKL